MEQISLVPGTSSVVIVKMSPTASSCGPSTNLPRRIFGPCRSAMMATALPSCRRPPCGRSRRCCRARSSRRGSGSCGRRRRRLRCIAQTCSHSSTLPGRRWPRSLARLIYLPYWSVAWVKSGWRDGPRPGPTRAADADRDGRSARTGAGRIGARPSGTCPRRRRQARPSAMAHTMSDWPRPASPATNTPSVVVM